MSLVDSCLLLLDDLSLQELLLLQVFSQLETYFWLSSDPINLVYSLYVRCCRFGADTEPPLNTVSVLQTRVCALDENGGKYPADQLFDKLGMYVCGNTAC